MTDQQDFADELAHLADLAQERGWDGPTASTLFAAAAGAILGKNRDQIKDRDAEASTDELCRVLRQFAGDDTGVEEH